jgi:hypothetical protein
LFSGKGKIDLRDSPLLCGGHFNLNKLYLDVADAYIKISSGFTTLSTADKSDLSK